MQADYKIAFADHQKGQRAVAFLQSRGTPILEVGTERAKPIGTHFFFRLRAEDVADAINRLRQHGLCHA